jgi:phage protein D
MGGVEPVNAAHPADTDGAASLREPAVTAAKAAARMAKFARMARPFPLFLIKATIGAPSYFPAQK